MQDQKYKEANDRQTYMKTLSGCLAVAVKDGYLENFTMSDKGLCTTYGICLGHGEVAIDNFYRFEGDSDPGDNSVLYLISTKSGLKGCLVDAYGPYANPLVAAYIATVEEIGKKNPSDNKE